MTKAITKLADLLAPCLQWIKVFPFDNAILILSIIKGKESSIFSCLLSLKGII